MNYILFDPHDIERYYPFTLTRPLGEMRVFGGTIKEVWEKYLGCNISYLTRDYLSDLYPTKYGKENIFISSEYLPNPNKMTLKAQKNPAELLTVVNSHYGLGGDNWVPYLRCSEGSRFTSLNFKELSQTFDDTFFLLPAIPPKDHLFLDFISWNDSFIGYGEYMKQCLEFSPFKKSNIDCSKNPFLNDDDGPIIVDKDVTIMEGAMIRGPVHICKGSIIKMGAKIYGPTVIGPYCKIGGEVSNCIFLGYSNKAHEGFLGHSIIGEWCNIGAGTSNSNLKNNYDTVKIWDYSKKKFNDSKQQFLGMSMGDHSKCAINTSFNTGTTIGVNCNIFGAGFPRNYIPSFSWGGTAGYKEYDIEKAINTAKIVMNRRNINMSTEYEKMLRKVFSMTADFRS